MSTTSVIEKAKVYFPNLQVVEKSSSTLMKIIAVLFFFNKSFMTSYLTTIGNTIYVPSMTWVDGNLPVLIHEIVHLYDEKRIGFFYNLAYLFPQILILLALPLFLFHWYIALPVILAFALPGFAPWRSYFEKRAYLIQLYIYVNHYHMTETQVSLALTAYFKNSTYYFMNIFQSQLTLTEANALLASDTKLNTIVNDLVASI